MVKKLITEGKALIEVDTADIVSKDLEVFYNPDMTSNRDISIAILDSYFDKPISIGLPLAGSGVRGIRMLKEIPHLIKKIAMNDMSSDATQLIKENLERNNIPLDETIEISEKDASSFLEDSHGYEYLDIDPYGSPNQFLDTSLRRTSRNGLLAVTATDTACLAGTYPNTCKQKYWSKSATTPLKHEMGLRILIRKTMLLGLHHGRALVPLLSYHYKHYYRVFFKVVKNKEKAAKLLDSLSSYVNYDTTTANFSVTKNPDESTSWCGPLYDGPLQDNEFLEKVFEKFPIKIIEQAKNEINSVGSYDTHQISQKQNTQLISLQIIIDELIKKGFLASRCTNNDHAIKTNASYEEVLEIISEQSKV